MFCFHAFNGLKVRHGIENFPPNLIILTVDLQNTVILTYAVVCVALLASLAQSQRSYIFQTMTVHIPTYPQFMTALPSDTVSYIFF